MSDTIKISPDYEWQIPVQEYFAVEVEFQDPPRLALAVMRFRECMETVDVRLPSLLEVLP